MKKIQFFVGLIVCLSIVELSPTARAEGNEKNGFTLLNPTPKDKMREMSTDRPDKTESPYTVDAGHYQIEADLVNYTRERDDLSETTAEAWNFALMNLKVGLTNRTDLQVVVAPYRREEEKTPTESQKHSGFAETILRVKVNLFGNDGGDVALGLMPFVKLPTAGDGLDNKKYEGGLIVPLALKLPNEFDMGVMFQVNKNKNEADNEYHTEMVSSVTVSHDLVGELGGYAEIYSESSSEEGAEWLATGDLGLTYGIGDDLQLDAGVNLGLTEAADDLNPFVGISARF